MLIICLALGVLALAESAMAQAPTRCPPGIAGPDCPESREASPPDASEPGPAGLPPSPGRSGLERRAPEGAIQIGPNVFGGKTLIGPGGTVIVCRPNRYGGQDCPEPAGGVSRLPAPPALPSTPNRFGGQDYRAPDGVIQSLPDRFGGQTYTGPGGWVITCRPTALGGQDCRQVKEPVKER
jgi:hypothetical protein